jgi:two-component system, LytTR family, sensor kinase
VERQDTIPPRWIFAAATALGVFSTTEAIVYHLIYEKSPTPWAVATLLNFSYWYVWAMLTPPILWVARKCPFDRNRWGRVILVHSAGVFLFTFAHSALSAYGRVLTVDWLAPERAIPFSVALRQRFVLNFDYEAITYWFLVGISHALDYRRQSAERAITAANLQARLAEANLEALQRQLHPHFLFNTLHTISALIHRNADAADAMLTRLSDLLRLTLHRVRTRQLPLKEELDFIEKYLEIERARYGDRLRVVFDVDPTVLDAAVPSLVLQPLVENALRHGIGPKVGGGRIDIIAKRDADRLCLVVRDDGYGVPADELDALNEGVGVSNTRARLIHLYGDRHRFEFRAPRGGGLEVTVVIPMVAIPEALDPAAMESVA